MREAANRCDSNAGNALFQLQGHALGLFGDFRGVSPEHFQRRQFAKSDRFIKKQFQRGFQRRKSEFSNADNSCELIFPHGVYQFRPAEDNAALGSTDQLIGTRSDNVGPFSNRFAQGRLRFKSELGKIDECTGANIVDHNQPVRMSYLDKLIERYF